MFAASCSNTMRTVVLLIVVTFATTPAFRALSELPVSFNKEIRPLLNVHCVKCHGGVKEAGKLHLLFREEALKGGKSGIPAIVPGKPEESELIARLTTTNEDDRMPKKAEPLGPDQIALLKRWIAEGAKWEEHWAYVPPERIGRSIDEVVKTRLKKEKLSLSPEADRWTLARRTALDLTGLPPSPDDVEAFVKDRSPKAYERWVDRLLESPAYGERWASVWLDIARYADSKGYEKDGFRDMWRYRDWLTDAFNSDKPYDQFLTEQLAGDLLPDPTGEQIIATAFHRNTQSNDEGGTDDEEFRTYAVIDRLNTTFDAVQGTSIGCVQCHGHPYDPFVHREFYELLAFFNNTADADREDETPTHRFHARTDQEKVSTLEQSIAGIQGQLDRETKQPKNQDAFETWLREFRPAENFMPLQKATVSSTEGEYVVKEEGRVRLEGTTPNWTTITVEATPSIGSMRALVLAMLPDDALPGRGPGAAGGNFILTRVRAVLMAGDAQNETPLEFTSARATFEQGGWPVAEALRTGGGPNGEDEGGWAIAGGTGKPQTATFLLSNAVEVVAGAKLRVTLECRNERWSDHVLGSFRLATSREIAPKELTALPDALRKIFDKDPARWTAQERTQLEAHFFSSQSGELAKLYKELERDRGALAALPVCNLPVMRELAAKESRTTRVFHRGNWMDKEEDAITPATPKILNGWHEDYPRDRLGLAKWLTNGENPLTARVHVNRVWQELFGIGLVETLEDFGSQGDKPVYQDLLDELASRFQTDMKWSQKALLREVVLSRVYRQSAKATPKLVERDPANRLLARGPRFRLTSEQLRDQALAIGGVLNDKMFGLPVMPYQPPGMWLTPYDGRDWITATNSDGQRRAIYTFIRRSATYPSFVTFDSPNREFCAVRRIRSNTPLQSLDLLNNPVFFEAAQALAKRMKAEGGSDLESQIKRGLFLATSRPPRMEQIAVLKKLHTRVDGNLTLVANAILNLDEVITKN